MLASSLVHVRMSLLTGRTDECNLPLGKTTRDRLSSDSRSCERATHVCTGFIRPSTCGGGMLKVDVGCGASAGVEWHAVNSGGTGGAGYAR